MKLARMTPVLLLTAATLAVDTIPALAQKGGGKDQPVYTFTDLGSYLSGSDRSLLGYNITNPDADGILHVVATGYRVTWDVTETGDVLNTNELPSGVEAGVINDAGMMAFRAFQGAWVTLFDIPGVGLVEPPSAGAYRPSAMNELGEVVGYSGSWDGVLWTVDVDGTISARQLPAFLPLAINDSGVMAGFNVIDSAAAVAWIDKTGEFQVQSLPGLLPGGFGVARGVNSYGEVVGYSTSNADFGGSWRPFLWSPDEGLIDLGTLGGTAGAAMDINDCGQVVGWSDTQKKGRHAFLWQNGKMADLNGFANVGKWSLYSAQAINEAGAIVGGSSAQLYGDAGYHTFLLTPKP